MKPLSTITAALLSFSSVHGVTMSFISDGIGLATPLFDPDGGTLLSPATSGNVVVLSGETLTINTDTGTISKSGINSFTSTGDIGNTEAAANGSKAVSLFVFRNLTVESGAAVYVAGSRAVGLLARENITINATLNITGKHASIDYPGTETLAGYAGGSAFPGYGGLAGDGIAGFGGAGGDGGGGGGQGGKTYTDARLIDL